MASELQFNDYANSLAHLTSTLDDTVHFLVNKGGITQYANVTDIGGKVATAYDIVATKTTVNNLSQSVASAEQSLTNVQGHLDGTATDASAKTYPMVTVPDFATGVTETGADRSSKIDANFNTWLDGIDFTNYNSKFAGRCKVSLDGKNAEAYNFLYSASSNIVGQLVIGNFSIDTSTGKLVSSANFGLFLRKITKTDKSAWTSCATSKDVDALRAEIAANYTDITNLSTKEAADVVTINDTLAALQKQEADDISAVKTTLKNIVNTDGSSVVAIAGSGGAIDTANLDALNDFSKIAGVYAVTNAKGYAYGHLFVSSDPQFHVTTQWLIGNWNIVNGQLNYAHSDGCNTILTRSCARGTTTWSGWKYYQQNFIKETDDGAYVGDWTYNHTIIDTIKATQTALQGHLDGTATDASAKTYPMVTVADFATGVTETGTDRSSKIDANFNTWLDGIDFTNYNSKFAGRCKVSLDGKNAEAYNFLYSASSNIVGQLVIGNFSIDTSTGKLVSSANFGLFLRKITKTDKSAWTSCATSKETDALAARVAALEEKIKKLEK